MHFEVAILSFYSLGLEYYLLFELSLMRRVKCLFSYVLVSICVRANFERGRIYGKFIEPFLFE